jgi:hypothetical protein
MTPQQKEIIIGFKKYIDQMDRTSTLTMTGEDFDQLQNISINIGRGRIDSCKTCIINALRQLYHEANN